MPVAHSFHHALAAPRSQCRFHLFLQNHFDHFPHPLPYRRLQPLPQRSLLALFHCNASLRHGVFLLCPEPPLKRFRDFSFNYFSGEYAFLFFYRNRDRTFLRKHWQELQGDLIVLHRVATQVVRSRNFILEKNDSQDDPTTRRLLEMTSNRFPDLITEFHDSFGRVVSKLNVVPSPRDDMALEVLTVVED